MHAWGFHCCLQINDFLRVNQRICLQDLPLDKVGNTMLLLLLSLLFCCLIELHCEDSHEISIPYLSFKDQNLSNNSYVNITKIGGEMYGSDSIRCRSELENCCQTAGLLSGSWSYPNGSDLGGPEDIYQSRGNMTADLRRRNDANTPVGIYCCRIAYISSDPSAKETLCVGLYEGSTGKQTIIVYTQTIVHPIA